MIVLYAAAFLSFTAIAVPSLMAGNK